MCSTENLYLQQGNSIRHNNTETLIEQIHVFDWPINSQKQLSKLEANMYGELIFWN